MDPRPYQVEILEKAKHENTIVCLGTGTGKTFISVMLIGEKQNKTRRKFDNGGKRTFFLVNTVPLAEQQMNVIDKNLPLDVKFFTGDMGVDFWNRDQWIKEFNANDVLVMTAQILLNILNHGFISLENINLLILDECHNATKKHPYVRIMELFVVAEKRGLKLPHIMGLTASIINESYKGNINEIQFYLDDKMKKLEATLRSKCVTCTDPAATAKFAPKPLEIVEGYYPGYDANRLIAMNELVKNATEYFKEAEKDYKEKKKQKKEDRDQSSSFNHMEYEAFVNRTSILGFKDSCSIALDAVKYCLHILETLGPLCAYEAACIIKKHIVNHTKRFKAGDDGALEECGDVLDRFMSSYKQFVETVDNVIPEEPFITKKAQKFLNILLTQKQEFEDKQNGKLHAIVFVQRRCTAVILNKLIQIAAEVDPVYEGLSSNYILGHGLDENIRLADSYMKSNQQSTVLEQFKESKFNVLVSTSVVEEGLDVRKCNLVVRFDGMSNYREYAQSKGRARAPNSKFIVMAEEGMPKMEMERQIMVMQNIERVLLGNCQNRKLPSKEECEQQVYDEITELIPTIFSKDGNARIPHHGAVSLLYRFCAYLPHDIYTRPDPMFTFTERKNGFDYEYQAECTLPHNFPLEQRIYKGDWMYAEGFKKGSELAKKQLASRICEMLRVNGELTEENLLPKRNKEERKKMKIDDDEVSSEDEETDDEEKMPISIVDSESSEDDELEKYEETDADIGSVHKDEKAEVKTMEGTRKNRTFYQRKVPDVLSKDFQLDDCSLYAISIVLSKASDKSKEMLPLWNGEYREGFGIFLSKNITKELPSFQVYSKTGEFTVNFVKISHDKTSLDKKLVKSYHEHICQKFFTPYVYKKLQFVNSNDDSCKDISRGFIVPLKPLVFHDLNNKHVPITCNTPVDYEAINRALNFGKPVGGSNRNPPTSTKVSIGDQVVVRKTYLPKMHEQFARVYCVIGPSKQKAGDKMDKDQTFSAYYKAKHGMDVHPETQLIDVVASAPKTFKYIKSSKHRGRPSEREKEQEGGDRKERRSERLEKLIPALCQIADGMSSQHYEQAHMLPYIFHKVEVLLNSEELTERLASKIEETSLHHLGENNRALEDNCNKVGNDNNSISPELVKMAKLLRSSHPTSRPPISQEIFEATTTKQALFGVDLERLEMLGDAFLKQAVSIYLFVKHPRQDEGKLTKNRQRCVRNSHLCKIAKTLDIQGYINNAAFGRASAEGENKNPITVWLPPSFCRKVETSDRFVLPDDTCGHPDKKIIDLKIERNAFHDVQDKSLADSVEALIGVYFKAGGVDVALKFISDVLNIPCLFKDVENKSVCNVEKNQASVYGDFPKPSTAKYDEDASNVTPLEELYEMRRLSKLEETIGYKFKDKSHIVRAMTHPSYDDNKVTRAYQEYEYLGDAILDFLVTLHIYSYKKQLSPGKLTDIKTALVNNNIFSLYTIKLQLHQHIFHLSPQLMRDCVEFTSIVAESTIEECFKNPFIVTPDSERGCNAPKVMGDLVESLAGAIFLDSGMDLIKVWEVFFPIMQPIIEKYIKDIPVTPKRRLYELYKSVTCQFSTGNEGVTNDSTKCVVFYSDGNTLKTETGAGKNKRMAEMMACHRALKKEGELGGCRQHKQEARKKTHSSR